MCCAFKAFPSQLTPLSLPFSLFCLGQPTFRLQPPGPLVYTSKILLTTYKMVCTDASLPISQFFAGLSPISQPHSSLISISTSLLPRMSMRHARRSVHILHCMCHP